MDRRVTSPKRVILPTWGPSPPAENANETPLFFSRLSRENGDFARQNLHARKNNRRFSLFVLFSHFRQHNGAPENFFFQMLSYARESTCICMHNY